MKISKNWNEKLQDEISLPYVQELKKFLEEERQSGHIIYPPEEHIFSAFSYTPYEHVKVVIIGQDPYHGPNQAHGLSFSVQENIPFPRSLKNIFQEISTDLKIPMPKTGCLIPWAKQGVFLLNSTLTVRKGEPNSHSKKGWERFTDAVVKKLLEREDPIVFLLWGKSAQEKGKMIFATQQHKALISSHPSPYSVSGFYGCKHFSKANNFLISWGKEPINWDLN